MLFRGVIFDLDGTLLDTLEDIGNAMNRVLASGGMPVHGMSAYRRFVGNGARLLVTRALPAGKRDSQTVQSCLESYLNDYGRHWRVRTRPYAGIPEMLDELARRKLKLAVLSNKPDRFTRMCVTELLPDWRFEAIIGSSDDLPLKPDPAGAFRIAEQLAIPAEEFLYLGDSAADMRTATAAGMFPVGVLWGFRGRQELLRGGARALIASPAEIVDVVEGRRDDGIEVAR